jgi:hypothetical protein
VVTLIRERRRDGDVIAVPGISLAGFDPASVRDARLDHGWELRRSH